MAGTGSRRLRPGSCAAAALSSETSAMRRRVFRIISINRRRPVRIGPVLGNGHLARLASVEREAVKARAPAGVVALEKDFAAARGPARRIVCGSGGEHLLARSVGLDDADLPRPRAAAGEGDPLAVRAPLGRRIPAA